MIFSDIQDKDDQYLLSPPFVEVNVCESFVDDDYFSQSEENFQGKKNFYLLIIFILLTNRLILIIYIFI